MPNEENLKPWKPGQSGNPKGKPRGKTLTPLLREMLGKKVKFKNPFTGEKKLTKISDAILINLIGTALSDKGSTKAIVEIFDRIDGKSPQKVDLEGNLNTKDEKLSRPEIISALKELGKRIKANRKTS